MSPRDKIATGIEAWDESIFSFRSSQHVTVPSLEKKKKCPREAVYGTHLQRRV